MKKLLLTVIFLAIFHTTTTFAVKVSSLYEAQLPVAAQTDDLKAQAIKDGFLQVLIKLSGDPQIAKNPIIQPNLKRADYYVKDISYSSTTTSSSQYTIQIRYDSGDVNRLLKKAGVAYWGQIRPLILVWLTYNDRQSATEIIGNESQGDIYIGMENQSKIYGIPLIFPVMDVDDISQVSIEDVVSMSMPILREAAKRYAPDALLIGNMEQTNNGVESKWRLVADGGKWDWIIAGATSNDVIASVMNQISKTLAKRFVGKMNAIPEIWIKVEVMNVTQQNDLADLMKYLKKLTLVQQIKLLEVSGDVVELSILLRGTMAQFEKNVVIGQRLVPKYHDKTDNRLGYVWSH